MRTTLENVRIVTDERNDIAEAIIRKDPKSGKSFVYRIKPATTDEIAILIDGDSKDIPVSITRNLGEKVAHE